MRSWLLLLALVLPGVAAAHDARPIYMTFEEVAREGDAVRYEVRLSVPTAMTRDALPEPVLPAGCEVIGAARMVEEAGAFVGTRSVSCSGDIAGQAIELSFPEVNPSLSLLIRLVRLNGEVHTVVLPPGESSWTVPEEETTSGVAASYLQLGVRHIWQGLDHLLFVTCLLFIARKLRRVIITITGFTVAHSITLALAALELVWVPVPPVEAAIALSVLLLAVEIADGDRSSISFRFPFAVATTFGLLHGLGFAAVLAETGLPQTEVPAALLFFNVGVEIGQILFILVLVGVFQLVRRSLSASGAILERATIPAAYLIGTVSGFWFLERVAGFFA